MDASKCIDQWSSHQRLSEEVVTELLSELLKNVCEKEQAFQPLPRSQPVDVCETVRLHTPQHVLGGYCEREGGWELLQVECVDQKASGTPRRVCELMSYNFDVYAGYCGHYCLYLAILCLQLYLCGSHDEALILLQKTRSVVQFWRRSIKRLCLTFFYCRLWFS